MQWPKHKIYWTIWATLILGMSVGSILTQKGFEPRAEFEILTAYEKAKTLFIIGGCFVTFYLAGTEYHELKRRIKSD